MVGQTISHYKITEKLGEGGMGVVYKAEDTKLKRRVALKFLATHLLKDEEARKRFDREAQAAAALHHPNVCPVYEIAETDGQTFLAMAFLEGESLDKRIEQGPLKIAEALDIAQQIARGLEAAHEKGVVHRDIKPGNVIVDDKGHATVMDFGLALLTEGSKLTQLDTTVGTVAYMSPEQAEGAEVDRRTDVWSLGCVVYEMVCGQRAFKGQYDQALLYEIVHEEPEPLTGLRTGVPLELEWALGKCLAKVQEERYQTTTELIVDLATLRKKVASGKSTILQSKADRAQTTPVAARDTANLPAQPSTDPHATIAPTAAAKSISRRRQSLVGVMFALTAVCLFVVALIHFAEMPLEAPLRRFTLRPPMAIEADFFTAGVAISPDGRHIVFAAAESDGRLWVQDLDQQQPRALEDTQGAVMPFWSPESDFIAFGAGGEIRKVSVEGGPPVRVCQLPTSNFNGGSWSPDGESIVFASNNPQVIYEVPSRGGTPSLLISPDQSDPSPTQPWGRLAEPHFLPAEAGAKVLVFTFGGQAERTMVAQDLETGRREILGPGVFPSYSTSGHLLYQAAPRETDLWAMPFSLDTLRATGEAFPIAQNGRLPTVARDQTLSYLDWPGGTQRQLVWYDRNGKKIATVGEALDLGYQALSPNEKLVAMTVGRDVWVLDMERGARVRLTSTPHTEYRAVWSPTGVEVAFASLRAGNFDILVRRADAIDDETVLVATPQEERVSDWSLDGKYILYGRVDIGTGRDLWYLTRNEEGEGWEARPFLQTSFDERVAKLSPNGRYIAYVSNESGRFEVYVQPFPDGGQKWPVSTGGGVAPRWSRDGTELFYVQGEVLVAVSVSTAQSFSPGPASQLFKHPRLTRSAYPQYEVSRDGRRFLVTEAVGEVPEPVIHVVQNWFAEFRDGEQNEP